MGGDTPVDRSAEIAADNRAAEQARNARADALIAQEKADQKQAAEKEEQDAAIESKKLVAQNKYAADEAARQAEAKLKTGVPTVDFANTRSKQAQAYQAGLTGFDSLPLKKKAAVATPQGQGAFAGQSNLPTGGFNIGNTGGRSYT